MTTILDWQRAYFREQADPGLRKTWPAMAVLMTYADRDLTCHPSQATIAKRAGIGNPDTVRKHLRANIDAGWLQRVKTGGPGKGSNVYRLTIPSHPHRGDIPSTRMGHIPSTRMPKQSNRTVHRTVQGTVQEGSHPQGWEPEGEPLASLPSGSSAQGEHSDPFGSGVIGPAYEKTDQPYPIHTDGIADPAAAHTWTSHWSDEPNF